MPVKRRVAKRRHNLRAADELPFWTSMFDAGFDFFGDLTALGLDDRADLDGARAAAREAWVRLGALFLADRDPALGERVPWALEAFGPPPGREGATNAR